MHRARSFLALTLACAGCVVAAEPPPGWSPRGEAPTPAPVPPPAAAPSELAVGAPPSAADPPPALARGARQDTRETIGAGQSPQIRLAAPGIGATRSLRPAANAGTEQRLTVDVGAQMDFSSNGSKIGSATLPKITTTWVVKVESVAADGARTVALSIEAASYDDAHSDERVAKATARAVATLGRVRGRFVLDPSGAPGPVAMEIDPRSLNDLRPAVEAVLLLVPLLFVPAPDTAVGIGAAWTSESALSYAELPLRQVAEYGVKTLEGENAEVTFDLDAEIPRPGPVAPGSRQVYAMTLAAEGTVTLDPRSPVPVGIDARVQAAMDSETMNNGETMKATLALDVQITARPAS